MPKLTPYYERDGVVIYNGDCLEVMRTMHDNCVDSIITDPPYGLSFMGANWDHGIPGVAYWREALRVAKPGATLMAFGGTRTYHRLTCAIEDAGWEIRDCISYFNDGTQQEQALMASFDEAQLAAYLELHYPGKGMAWVYGCLSEDTEILTSNGFKRYHKAIASDAVLCYNIDSDNFKWEKPLDVYRYEYDDTAYRIRSDFTDQIVSRNHRCIVEREGTLLFDLAENLRVSENIPTVENLRELSEAIHGGSTQSKCQTELQQGMCNGGNEKTTSSHSQANGRKKDNIGQMRDLQQGILQARCLDKEKQKPLLQQPLQRHTTGARMEGTCSQGQGSMVRGNQREISQISDGPQQSSLEGRCNLSPPTWELRQPKYQVCEMPKGIYQHGEERRLCDGASFDGGKSNRPLIGAHGNSTPCQPQRGRQPAGKFNVIREQQSPQAIRASRYTRTDLATITPVHYKGIMWCVKVPSGAFIARRNGKIFITGNSGFPKSANISKQLDKRAVVDCPKCNGNGWIGEKPKADFKPHYEGICDEHGKVRALDLVTQVCSICQSALDDIVHYDWPSRCVNCDGTGKVVGAEREVVGKRSTNLNRPITDKWEKSNKIQNGSPFNSNGGNTVNITAPATPLAKEFDGYHSHGLKPAYEPIVLAMKPMGQSYAANAEEWGVSGLNVDGGRVEHNEPIKLLKSQKGGNKVYGQSGRHEDTTELKSSGRWPANLLWDGSDEVEAEFAKAGASKSSDRPNSRGKVYSMDSDIYGDYNAPPLGHQSISGDKGGSASRFFQKCPPDPTQHPEAARFHYCSKAGPKERATPGNNHPTQKPISLLKYLVRLVRPPSGGVVLDPFAGSGTTALACLEESSAKAPISCVLIEKKPEYAEICKRRVAEYRGETIAPKEVEMKDEQKIRQLNLW